MNGVLDTCVRAGLPGWAVVGQDIVVSFWPRGSAMDGMFGLTSNDVESFQIPADRAGNTTEVVMPATISTE